MQGAASFSGVLTLGGETRWSPTRRSLVGPWERAGSQASFSSAMPTKTVTFSIASW